MFKLDLTFPVMLFIRNPETLFAILHYVGR
jgi:hypothetical protein